jgi:uncharacterized membrane protein YfcA
MPAGSDLVLLFAAGIVTGVMNAVAGGGSFVAFRRCSSRAFRRSRPTSQRRSRPFPGNSPASGPIATTSAPRPGSTSGCCSPSASAAACSARRSCSRRQAGLIAIYGGYFGAGIGFMMLAALTLYGMRDIHAMNGLKLVLALCMTIVSSAAFVYAGKVYGIEALVMCVATLIGGYGGALGAKRVKPELIKIFIAFHGAGLTLYFFVHGA